MGVIKYETEEAWLEGRRKSIGASEAPAVLGISRWKTPLALYCEKVGLVPPPDLSDNEAVEWGLRLEPLIAEKYTDETGRELQNPGQWTIHEADDHSFLTASLDRIILPSNGKPQGVLEIKTTSEYLKGDWAEGVPLAYQVQNQQQMLCAELTWGSFAALIGGQSFRWGDTERDDRFLRELVEAIKRFWYDHVLAERPPQAGAGDHDLLAELFPREEPEKAIALSRDALDWSLRLADLAEAIKQAKAEEKALKAKLKQQMEDAEVGVLPEEAGQWRWKEQSKKEHVVKAWTGRVLTRGKGRK